MIEWLQFLYAICTSDAAPANWREITILANLGVAIAYFWIPIVMAVVFARWRNELPFRWLWAGFVVFIVACGLSHLVHAAHAVTSRSPHNWFALSIMVGTAVVSLITAAAFTFLLPRILQHASPADTKRRLEEAVETATADLQRALSYERVLLREVHHRVKNNLQVTASLVSLHIRRASPGSVAELRSLRDRVEAMAAVHAQLQDVGSSALRARPFIELLIRSLTHSLGRDGIEMKVTGDDFDVPLDHATSFALILHEVLANALRHGFPNDRPGLIAIHLDASDGDRAITVSDNGTGFASDRRSGIGDTLIRTLAIQLGAQTQWRSDAGTGTVFTLRFAEQDLVDRLA
ncbi:sensor histidine kinase [Bosea sp. AAP35]|uniref:sensor histidine kinase n=1 Tax=Bosea sp. AAP35 TaxID=1523417 RepID=UPI0006B97A9C|nr:sensor histidine kinase [Bosea sp. AAP35]